MLSDVGQPQCVGSICCEVTLNEIVVYRWTSFSSQTAFLGENRPYPLLRAQPPHPLLAGYDTGFDEFIGDEPVSECRIIMVNTQSSVDQMGIVPVPLRARIHFPLAVSNF